MTETNDAPEETEHSEHELTFPDVAGIFFNQAAIALGAAPHPMTGQVIISFEAAQESISILELLKEKTQGNLVEDEERILDTMISELKLAFVHAIKDPRVREAAERSQRQAQAEPSMIVTPDGRPASAADTKPRIIIP